MNEKQVILDYLEYERGQYTGQDERDVDEYLAQKETQEKDPEWFMETFWTENRA